MEETQFTLDLPNINLLDALVYVALIVSGVVSMSRGLTRELSNYGAWALAALVTLFLVGPVAQFLMPYLKDPFPATIFATGGTFLIALFILSPIKNSLARKYMRPGEEVGVIDNITGLGFGLVKGWIFVILGFAVFTLAKGGSAEGFQPWVTKATTLPMLERSVNFLARGLPDYIQVPSTNLSEKREEGKKGVIEQFFGGEELEKNRINIRIPGSDSSEE